MFTAYDKALVALFLQLGALLTALNVPLPDGWENLVVGLASALAAGLVWLIPNKTK